MKPIEGIYRETYASKNVPPDNLPDSFTCRRLINFKTPTTREVDQSVPHYAARKIAAKLNNPCTCSEKENDRKTNNVNFCRISSYWAIMKKTKYFCVGHAAPIFSVSQQYLLVAPETSDHPDGLVISDDYFGEMFDGKILSEYTQLFALADHLEDHHSDSPERVYIFQYRKFLSLQSTPTASTNNPWSFVATREQAQQIFPSMDTLSVLPADFLVGPCVNFGHSLSKSYSISHIADDFVGFCVALSGMPDFDDERCERFFRHEILIPAPSLSMQPRDFFINSMNILRRAWLLYRKRFYRRREGYQRRVGGFLLERLHSFLLCEHLMHYKKEFAMQGQQITVNDTAYVPPTI